MEATAALVKHTWSTLSSPALNTQLPPFPDLVLYQVPELAPGIFFRVF